MLIITTVSVCILFLVSFLHVYWAFGGSWGTNAVIPIESGEKTFMPRRGNNNIDCTTIKYGSNKFVTTSKNY